MFESIVSFPLVWVVGGILASAAVVSGVPKAAAVLIEDGVPTDLFSATAEGRAVDLKDATRTLNIVFPLSK